MSIVSFDTIVKLLDRWQVWQELRGAAARVPELERRVAALEAKLTPDAWPADVCQACGQRELRLAGSFVEADRWECRACGVSQFRPH